MAQVQPLSPHHHQRIPFTLPPGRRLFVLRLLPCLLARPPPPHCRRPSLRHLTWAHTSRLAIMSRIQQDQFVDDDEDECCPLCVEEFDLSDRNFRPCPCGYQVRLAQDSE